MLLPNKTLILSAKNNIIWPSVFVLFLQALCYSPPVFSNNHRLNSSTAFSTYIGGNNNESAYAIAIDSQKNIFISGETNSEYFESFPIPQGKFQFNQNCFVLKISASSPINDFYFEFSGSQRETCREIAIDEQDNIYLTGETQSNDLPVTTDRAFGGEWDAFLLKLSNTGELLYASYIGGNLTDYGHGLVVESIDNIYVTGETWSTNFPTTNNAFMKDCKPFTSCDEDAKKSQSNIFLTHINTQDPAKFISEYSTYLGGTNYDKAHDLAIDKNRHLHIVGETRSQDFPLVNQFSSGVSANNSQGLNGTYDAFLAVINPHISTTTEPNNTQASRSLVLSTYIGGSKNDFAFSVTTDNAGASYIAGETWSDDFPVTPNAFAKKCATGLFNCNQANAFKDHADAFVIVVSHNQLSHSNTTSTIQYASYIGGEGVDSAHDIFIDGRLIYITGTTSSNKFPITNNAIKNTCNTFNQCDDFNDGFLVAINTDNANGNGNGLIFSSFIGGNDKDTINAFGFNKKNTLTNTQDGSLNRRLNNWPSQNFSSIFVIGQTFSSDILNKKNSSDVMSILDKKIENGEVYIQQVFIENTGNWIDQYPQPNASAINTSNKTRQSMASSISYILLLLISLPVLFRPQPLQKEIS